eukprot:351557-Chlamydomonas_euryale.AAC.23
MRPAFKAPAKPITTIAMIRSAGHVYCPWANGRLAFGHEGGCWDGATDGAAHITFCMPAARPLATPRQPALPIVICGTNCSLLL